MVVKEIADIQFLGHEPTVKESWDPTLIILLNFRLHDDDDREKV